MQTNRKITVLFIVFLTVIFLLPEFALAQDTFGINRLTTGDVANTINLGSRSLESTIARIINVFLGFLGVIATSFIIYGGFIWMTSSGNAEKIDKAKGIIRNAVIGLLIILAAVAITQFAFRLATGQPGSGGGGGGGGFVPGTGLGGGVLESHYPGRNSIDIARNTNIYITFKEDMNLSTIVLGGSGCAQPCDADTNFIKVREAGTVNDLVSSDLKVTFDAQARNIQINPYGNTNTHLGNPNGSVRYEVVLAGLETAGGDQAFPFSGSYSWNFTVSNVIDLTPPTVVSVLPANGSAANPRNSVVQINFSEAINPIFATGVAPGFTNIELKDPGNVTVNGEYIISNQYRTVEFIADTLCGQNSCGGDVYCLPASTPANIVGEVRNTIQDMATNSLDCGANCNAGGHYEWAFETDNNVDLIAPEVVFMTSANSVGLLPVVDPIVVTFDKPLLSSSVNSSNISLQEKVSGFYPNYWLSMTNVDTFQINHDKLNPSTVYEPKMTSGIKDSSQNCWFPCRCTGPSCDCNIGGACGAGGCQVP